jgi:quinol monooxygenase YgiN
MTTVIATLQVPSFEKWRAEYEQMHAVREAAGECGRTVFRDVDNPGVVVVVFRWSSLEAARSYFDGPALQASVGRAGAVAPPALLFLEPA